MKFLKLFPVFALGSACLLQAEIIVDPPEYAVREEPFFGRYFSRLHNPTSRVEVYRAKDLAKMWACTLTNHDHNRSKVLVSANGRYLAHLQGNHNVDDLDDVCVEIFSDAGQRFEYKVRDLMPSLVKTERSFPGPDALPDQTWMRRPSLVGPKTMTIYLANQTTAVFTLGEKGVEIRD